MEILRADDGLKCETSLFSITLCVVLVEFISLDNKIKRFLVGEIEVFSMV